MKAYPEMNKEIVRLLDMEGMPLSVYAARCIEKLQAENAKLRERLEKAVELPCRVGDTVYEKGMYEGDVYEHRISKIIFDAEKISFDCTAIGNSIFLTRAAAEARLKELAEEEG